MKRHLLVFPWVLWLLLPLLLWWAWRGIPLAQVWEIVRQMRFWQLATLAILDGFLVLLFSLRWWLILRVQGYKLSYMVVSAYHLAGFAISYLTPGTQFGGEPLLIVLLHQRKSLPVSAAIASVTLDKLLELLANYLFLLFAVLVVLASGAKSSMTSLNMVLILAGLLILPIIHLVVLWGGKRPAAAIITWLTRHVQHPRFESLHQVVHMAENQVGEFCRHYPLLLVQLLVFSQGVWALSVLEHWLIYNFLGLRLPFASLMALVAAMRLAFLTPLPGGLGVLEASQVWVLGWLGLQPAFGVGAVMWIRLRDLILAGAGAWLAAHLSRNGKVKAQPAESSG